MPLALVFIGIALLVTAIRGTQGDLFTLLKADVPGWGKWAAAIVAVGALGYIPKFEGPARALLALVLIVIVLANKGLFTTLAADLKTAPAATPAQPLVTQNLGPVPVKVDLGASGAGGIGGIIGGLTGSGGGTTGGSVYGVTGTGGL